jgi:hypothetical protein
LTSDVHCEAVAIHHTVSSLIGDPGNSLGLFSVFAPVVSLTALNENMANAVMKAIILSQLLPSKTLGQSARDRELWRTFIVVALLLFGCA